MEAGLRTKSSKLQPGWLIENKEYQVRQIIYFGETLRTNGCHGFKRNRAQADRCVYSMKTQASKNCKGQNANKFAFRSSIFKGKKFKVKITHELVHQFKFNRMANLSIQKNWIE